MAEKNVFLLLGSNLGDRLAHLQQSIFLIGEQIGSIEKVSAVYQTAAWGKTDQPDFLNQVIQVETSLTPTELLKSILSIEQKIGRTRNEKWDARIIDIDILYFGNEVIHTADLVVPHSHLHQRRFVLAPLAEINSAFVHPVLKRTNAELLNACNDPLQVDVFTN